MEERWIDPEAPWWAKLRRARVHITEVRERVDVLQAAGAWSILREPADHDDAWAYRFRLHRAIPADLSTVVADAVGNMRSALDYVAYELARHHAGKLTDKEEIAAEFPICLDEAAFVQFFGDRKKGGLRSGLYGDVEREALQCVQPFALTDEARALGIERSTTPQDDLLTDHAQALTVLWNIEKHRRLPELAWALGPVWWSLDVASPGYRWVWHVKELAPLRDDAVLGALLGPPGSGRPQVDPPFEMHLVLTDDPSPYASPLVARLERLHQSLARWVVPRMFIVAGGDPPPIMISFSEPT
ncbi:MAG: hypothetical protein ABSB01_01810 [Streptosporangiaceae bacterium]|jgi:hypothetical protein